MVDLSRTNAHLTSPAPGARIAEASTGSLLLDDLGKLLLRVSVAAMLMMHGIAKLSTGVDGIAGMLQQRGLPGTVAYAVFIGELLAPLAMLLGVWTRLAAVIAAINMVVAIWLAHAADLFRIGPQGGWAIELQGLFLFGTLAVALLGAGRFSLGGRHGRFN